MGNTWRAEIWGRNWAEAPESAQEDLHEFGRLSLAGLTWAEARDRLAEWWPVPEVLAALAEAPEGEPFKLEVELGGVPGEVARWLNPLVLRGTPSLKGVVHGSKAQAELYATWPRFSWSKRLRLTLPGTFPRAPDSQTSKATQFGVIPPGDHVWSKHDALPVRLGPTFGTPFGLASSLARAARLDVGVDATLRGRDNGWPRVVQDILESAPRYWFRGQQRFVPVADPRWPSEAAGGSGDAASIPGRPGRARGGRFAIVHVGFGPQGALD